MFGSRRKAPAIPTLNTVANVNPSATAAAAQAYLARHSSTTSLSTAAAAAALRSRPTTPTAVADVQTRRTMRRANSNSSMGSSLAGSAQGRPGLQRERRLSNGSMTERTFRDPSPHRGPVPPSMDDAPPLPPIPKLIPPANANSQRRTASLDVTAPRVASSQLKPNGRGASLGPVASAETPPRMHRRAASSNLQELAGTKRPESRGSVNFSYPTSFRRAFSADGFRTLTSSTPSQSQRGDSIQNQNLVYDPNTRSFRPQAELLFIEQSVRDVANRPIRINRKPVPHRGPGNHLADGTVGGRPRGTALDLIERKATPRPAELTPPPAINSTTLETSRRRKKKPVLTDSHPLTPSETDSDTSERQTDYSPRTGLHLAKKPSVIREQDEGEEGEDQNSKDTDRQAALRRLESGEETGKPLTLPVPAGRGRGSGRAETSLLHAPTRQENRSISLPNPAVQATIPDAFHGTNSMGSANGGINGQESATLKPNRVQSLSPARNAHFLPSPEGATNLAVRHQPPGRSISPRKSALKQVPSPRGLSPTGEHPSGWSHGRGPSTSEVSDTSTAISDDRQTQRKKLVRVSFDDDHNVILGQADPLESTESPILESPQNKRTRFSGMGHGKKKDVLASDEGADEFMTPRPALPSFGSIREKSRRGSDDPPQLNSVDSAATTLSPSIFTTAAGKAIDHPLGISSDEAVGAIIAYDLAQKNEANVSKSREPLPPEVTSKEVRSYDSDSDSTTYSVDKFVKVAGTSGTLDSVKRSTEDGTIEGYRAFSSSPSETENQKVPMVNSNGNGNVPIVSITRASPTAEGNGHQLEDSTMPGEFPVNSSESDYDDSQMTVVEHRPTHSTISALGVAESEPTGSLQRGPPIRAVLSDKSQYLTNAEKESDDESIYVDAAEDLSDLESHGFMSLDAIVDSPMVHSTAAPAGGMSPECPPVRSVMDKTHVGTPPSQSSADPLAAQGWDKAQQYWSGLTAEKKREMERAAREATSDSDEEIPAPKFTKKVVVTVPREEPGNGPIGSYNRDRTYQILPGTKAGPDGPTLRSSLRSPPPRDSDEIHMRKSMRDAGSGSLRGSMRGSAGAPIPQPKGSLQKKFRPLSLPVEPKPDSSQVRSYSTNLSAGAAGAALTHHATTKPAEAVYTLRRIGSDGSVSSFKRSRLAAGEGYTMKRSMRGSALQPTMRRAQSPDSVTSGRKSNRFSLRSTSPNESGYRKGLSSFAPPLSMSRMTMRDGRRSSNDSNASTIRPSSSGAGKPSMRLFGKSKPEVNTKSAKKPSRFDDSSDEDEVRPVFRSRYVDSSDDEDVPSVSNTAFRSTTLRAIPRKAGVIDGDSSDLPDTDDEKSIKTPKTNKANRLLGLPPPGANVTSVSQPLRRSRSGRGELRAATMPTSINGDAAPTGPGHQRKSSFMSILRRKKDQSSKVHKSEAESAARRDTPLERSRSDLLAVRHQDTLNSPVNEKLQKRSPVPNRVASDSWPSPLPGQQYKPETTDGLMKDEESRPGLGSRRGTTDDDFNVPRKKKRFGILRRAFGLDE